MSTRRKLLIGSTIVAAALWASQAKALIPVFDGSAVAELILQISEAEKAFALQAEQYATQIKMYAGEYFSWVTQTKQYLTQMAQYYTEGLMLLNFAHHPTFGAAMGLMNNAGLGNGLPFNPYALANLIDGRSYGQGGFGSIGGLVSGLTNLAGASYAQNRVYTPTDGSWASMQINATANSLAGSEGASMAAYGDFRDHMGVLPALRQNAATADTTKDAQDAGNMLLAETAWNLNQMGQAQQIAYMAAMQRDARVQHDEERLACELEMFRAGGGACPTGSNGAMAGAGGGPNGGSATMPVPPVPPLAGVDGTHQPMTPPIPVPPAPPDPPPEFNQPTPPPVSRPPVQPPPQTGA